MKLNKFLDKMDLNDPKLDSDNRDNKYILQVMIMIIAYLVTTTFLKSMILFQWMVKLHQQNDIIKISQKEQILHY